METKEKKQAYVDFLEIGGKKIAFNCHAEDVKRWMKNETVAPDIIVIGDTTIFEQVPLACPEFPFLKSIFVEGGFDFANKQVKKPLLLVGKKKRIHAHAESLRLAFHGPTETEYRNQIRPSEKVREMLWNEQKHLANKDANGKIIPFDDYVQLRPFDDKGCALIDDKLMIRHIGKDHYVVHYGGKEINVKLDEHGEIGPSWPIPELKNIETPHEFRVFVLGSDSGFGRGPTTTYLIEMNGEYVMWDCAPYCAWTLAYNGIEPGQVKKIIISHAHDDHANDLIPFALSSSGKVEIMGTKEVLYSLKKKLIALTNISEIKLKSLFRWTEIKVSKKMEINGYCFDFHYGFHPIPSIGVTISLQGKHYVTITGDTGFNKVLDPALEAGVVTAKRRQDILNLLKKGDVILADMGKAMIHGDEQDLAGLELPHIYMYHTDVLPAELQEKANLVKPGNAYAVREMNPVLADIPVIAEVLHSGLGVQERLKWTKNLSQRAEIKTYLRGSLVLQKDSYDKDYFYIVAFGHLDVMIDDQVVATLRKGDFFGEQALLTGKVRNASILARTPVRLIAIPANLFKEMMEEDHNLTNDLYGGQVKSALQRLETIWDRRMVISEVRAFKALLTGKKNDLALQVEEIEFAPGDVIVRQGSTTDEVYIVAKGKVEVCLNAGPKNPILGENVLFGEAVPLGFAPSRTADVRALTHCKVFVMPGEIFKRLYDEIPRVHFELNQIAEERNIKVA